MTAASGQRPRCGLLGAAEAREAEVGRAIPQIRSVSANLARVVISCTSGSFLSLAVDWKCPVYETHLDKGTPWLRDGTVLSVEVFKD